MRLLAWIAVFLAACSDMGPRDRSLLLRTQTFPLHKAVFREKRPVRPTAQPSVIGLATDPLAPLYVEDPSLVIRFAELSTLERGWKTHVAVLRELLPELGLPELPVATLLRVRFGLPDSVVVERGRPFAFVRTPAGWAALLPVNGDLPESERLRRLDAHYCVAGSAAAVSAYAPGFRSGFHLPGDVAVMARSHGRIGAGEAVREAAAMAGIALPPLPGLGDAATRQIRRIDVALRFLDEGARLDVRLAPDRGLTGGIGDYVGALHPREGDALRWLPHGATIEVATGSDIAAWLDLLRMLGCVEGELPMLREAVRPLGDDAAFQLHLRGERPGVAMLVAELVAPDREAAERYIGGESLRKLLRALSGNGGHLEYTPRVFSRDGVSVGTVTGYFSDKALEGLRARGGAHATLAEFLRGPVVIYLAMAGNRLCVVAGERSRDDMEALLDRITGGKPRRTDECGATAPLLHDRLFAARIAVAALLRGTRESARHWHPRGDRLTEVEFEEELALDLVASVEGGALRFAAQVPDAKLAAVVARVRDALRGDE